MRSRRYGSARLSKAGRGTLAFGASLVISACSGPGAPDGGAAGGPFRAVSFFAAPTFAAGDVEAVVLSDLDGDGAPDLAAATYDGAVSILLNDGDGSFAAPLIYTDPALGAGARSLSVADLNGDGKPDLAAASDFSGNVSVRFNEGDGHFASPVTYLVAGHVASLGAGDVNGDGQVDLVALTISGLDGRVSVLLNDGEGTFTSGGSYAAGAARRSLAVADLNGDGQADLAVGDSQPDVVTGSPPSAGVLVLLNNGDGTFPAPVTYDASAVAGPVVAADLNGDGRADLVSGPTDGGNRVSVLLNHGDGTFTPARRYPTGDAGPLPNNEPIGRWGTLATGDLNGDGRGDVAVVSFVGEVSVLMNDGAGELGAPVTYGAGYGPGVVAVGDLNGDGKPDLVTASDSGPGYVTVVLNRGEGRFVAAPTFDAGGRSFSMVAADFNGDGKLDLASATPVSSNGSPGSVNVLLGGGDGTLGVPVAYGASDPWVVVAGDVNGDGRLDLLTANFDTGTVSVLLGRQNGTFGSAVDYPSGSGPTGLALGDVNGDGRLDVVVANYRSQDVSVFLNNGDGTFADAVTYLIGCTPVSVAVADLDGDGKVDLAVTVAGSIDVMINRGDGTFAAPAVFPAASSPSTTALAVVAVSDLNADGRADLIAADYNVGALGVLLNQGAGVFAAPLIYPTGQGAASIAVGDLDVDGKPDIAVASFDGRIDIFINRGDGTFSGLVAYAAGGSLQSVVAGDLNGDGKPDLAVSNAEIGPIISVLLNTSR